MSSYFFETTHYCPVCNAEISPKAEGVEKVQRKSARPLYVHSRCFQALCRKRREKKEDKT